MYAETIKPPATSDNSLTPALNYYGTETRVDLLEIVWNKQKVHTLMEK